MTSAEEGSGHGAWWRALRPEQWVKNTVIAAPVLFALGDRTQMPGVRSGGHAAAAVLLFCLVSSGVYLLNDIRDREQDRAHPRKRTRPLASGAIRPAEAALAAAGLLATGLGGALLISLPLAAIAAGYVAVQAAYTLWLKRIVLLDGLVIAGGFVLRAVAGAVAARVAVSPWLLLCTFLLALFLALCKRRHEKLHVGDHLGTRSSLRAYDLNFLDPLLTAVTGATIAAYTLYTLWPDTVEKFGTRRLAATVPFVVFGLVRYLYLVRRRAEGDRPERVMLTDGPLRINLALYTLILLFIFFG